MKLKLKTLTGEVHEVDVEDTNATVKDVKVNLENLLSSTSIINSVFLLTRQPSKGHQDTILQNFPKKHKIK